MHSERKNMKSNGGRNFQLQANIVSQPEFLTWGQNTVQHVQQAKKNLGTFWCKFFDFNFYCRTLGVQGHNHPKPFVENMPSSFPVAINSYSDYVRLRLSEKVDQLHIDCWLHSFCLIDKKFAAHNKYACCCLILTNQLIQL